MNEKMKILLQESVDQALMQAIVSEFSVGVYSLVPDETKLEKAIRDTMAVHAMMMTAIEKIAAENPA